ncbi:hypothetical protein DRO48_01575 [Candidatus Bathyarchaeota archaeon]|nr:MAG: hypothetical protein DRO48_01575 [Candidatus Bathyarchaeota archaeon]
MRKKIGEETVIKDVYATVCDECGRELKKDEYGCYCGIKVDYTWDEYGDEFGEELDFCSFRCMMKYLKDELKGLHSAYGRYELKQMPERVPIRIYVDKMLLNELLEG